MKLISWNMRGLGIASKRDFVKSDLHSIGAGWVGLQEMKLNRIDNKVVKQMCGHSD